MSAAKANKHLLALRKCFEQQEGSEKEVIYFQELGMKLASSAVATKQCTMQDFFKTL